MSRVMLPRHRLSAVVLATLVFLSSALMQVTAAWAQDATLDISIRSAEVGEDGTSTVVVDVTGASAQPLDAEAFGVAEDDVPVDGLVARPSNEADDPEQRTVLVTLDTSGSTAGQPLELAKEAVNAFTETVTARDVAVGLITFSDQAELVVAPTTDAAAVVEAVDAAVADGGTALYDAVVLAATALQDIDGQGSIVVFSDGADEDSTTDLATAVRAVTIVGAEVTAVALQTGSFDPQPLQAMADATGGRVLEVDSSDQLQTAFDSVAERFTSQYVLTYPNTGRTGQFDVQAAVTVGTRTAADTVPVLSTVTQPGTFEPAATEEVAAPGPLQRPWVGWVALVITSLGMVLFLVMLLVPPGDRVALANLRASLGGNSVDTAPRNELTPTTAALSRQAIRLVERVPKPEGYDHAVQVRLDRAAWPLRSSEYTTLRAILVLVVSGLVWAVSGSLLLGVLGGVVGWILPELALGNRVRARQEAFMEQLPDTLQLLAGSMKAGYGVLQAIDTVVKESQEPTRAEFQRVLTEARLGMPLEDSLTSMAERIGTDDFRWVAVAINIQRRVGGNLASLLETVANTLRERAATRRQIRSLSAEGRISAVILTALPIVLGLYMFVVNPDYIGELFTDQRGQLMLAAGALAMIMGIVWMRNLVEIDV